MCLPISEVDRFYRIWQPLLRFANEELNVVTDMSGKGPTGNIDATLAAKVRDALWDHETILDKFIVSNPAQLSTEDLKVVDSWRYRSKGQFFLFKVLKKHAIFIGQEKITSVFAVKGLYTPFERLFGPNLPALVETVLLPFGDDIVADGLLQSYSIIFGSGIRGELKEIYEDAKERGAIITTLLPNQQIPTREYLVGKAGVTNTKVLEAFSKYQYQSGRSPKTVERDVLNVTSFAHFLLSEQPEPSSLRDFQQEALKRFLMSVPEKGRKPVSMSIKRFLSFMHDTGRLNWDEAEDMMGLVKQQ
jgi:hypothetical protein